MGQKLTISFFEGDGPISKHFKRREYGFRSGIYERQARAASKEKLAERL